jgi:glycosyltransferase involved in cell wall biosynthesis
VSRQPAKADVRIPTRSVAPYIHEAIECVLAQTRQDWTLLISENGAPGGKLEQELQQYLSDPRISYQAIGADLSAATNHTRLITSGDAPYVGILHDDDRWDPEFLERRIEFLDAHADCGFVFSGNYEIDSKSRRTGESKLMLAEGAYGPSEMVPLLIRRNVIGMPTLLVRREAYDAVGPAFDEETVFFDYEMWLRLALKYPTGYLPVRDADYRIHDTQITMTSKRRGEQQLRLFQQIDGMLASAPEIPVDRTWLRRRIAGAHLSAALDDLEDGNRAPARRHVRQALKTYPPSAIDPRTPTALVAFALGRYGRGALRRLRYLVLRRHIRVHVRN